MDEYIKKTAEGLAGLLNLVSEVQQLHADLEIAETLNAHKDLIIVELRQQALNASRPVILYCGTDLPLYLKNLPPAEAAELERQIEEHRRQHSLQKEE
jgi:hypothetical protein